MAKNYKATLKGKCWKQHTCIICNSSYRYRFERSVEATSSTPAAAQEAAAKNLQVALNNGVDQRACPHCGLMQPEMIGHKRSEAHGCMIALSFVVLIVLWIVWGFGWAQYHTVSYIAAALGAFIAVRHIWVAVDNPNADLAANKAKAAGDVNSGVTLLVQQGNDPGLGAVATEVSGGMKFAMMLLLAAPVAFPSAEFMRLASGWNYNDRCDPPVVGPGETVRYFTGDSIESIKGYWDGRAAVALQNGAELGLSAGSPGFTAASRKESWGGTIYSKSSENHTSSKMYADIGVPAVTALEHKSAALAITLDVTSPQSSMYGSFVTRSNKFAPTLNLAIAVAGAGKRYLQIWWTGMALGFLLQIVGGFLLVSKAGSLKKGLPTQLIPMS